MCSDGIMLLGGSRTNTTEVIPPTGEAAVAGDFAIRHGESHCTIALTSNIGIVTGGHDTSDLVTSYTLPGGSPRPLPPLQEGRWGHACSWYYRGEEKVSAFFHLLPYEMAYLPHIQYTIFNIIHPPSSLSLLYARASLLGCAYFPIIMAKLKN